MLQTTSKTKKLLLYSTISLATAIVLFSFTIAETCCLRGPTSEAEIPSNENFVHIEHLRLTDFKDKHFFLISNTESYSQLVITNEMTTSPITLNLELTCDQKFQFGIPRLSPDISTRNLEHLEQQNSIQNYRFQLESTKGAIFLLGNKIKNCELKYHNVTEVNQSAQYKILSEDTAFPLMKNLLSVHGTKGLKEFMDLLLKKSLENQRAKC